MTKIASEIRGLGKAKIVTRILNKAPKGADKKDILNLECINSKGKKYVDCYITPNEAVKIASVLLDAYVSWSCDKNKKKYMQRK